MQIELRAIETQSEALECAQQLEPWARHQVSEWRAEPLPQGALARWIGERFGARETVLVGAFGAAGEWLGAALSGPFEEPLGLERQPMVLLLFVDERVRHRGLARALLDDLRRRLRARGFAGVLARAGHNDDALISMAERWGFTRQWELMELEG